MKSIAFMKNFLANYLWSCSDHLIISHGNQFEGLVDNSKS